MQVFVSYASANREWAEKLKADLRQHGFTVGADSQIQPGQNWAERIEQAARNSEASIILLAPQSTPDEKQSRTWQVALEAVWNDSEKRLIPFLLYDAEVPAFARSTALDKGGYLPVIRARDPQHDWEQAVAGLIALLRHEGDLSQVEQVPAITEADREEWHRRRASLRAYIEEQKAFLPSPEEWRMRASHY